MKFNVFEIKELENLGCDFVTPYQGSKQNMSFFINKKGIFLDTYIYKKDILINIKTEQVTFEELKKLL